MRNDQQEMWFRLRKFVQTASAAEIREAIQNTDSGVLDPDPEVARTAMAIRIFLMEELQARQIAATFPRRGKH